MKLSEACERIGAGVVYSPHHGHREDGTIVSVNEHFVFVHYAGDRGAKATRAEDLEFLSG